MAQLEVEFIGHSALVIELDGIRLLTDPVTRARVGPLRRVEAVPDRHRLAGMDAVLISHLHWDHLDVPSLRD
ncbi:MAG: MBL fold metallo-hydrolase, partial [Chloroflexota bacterium]|nr:MBL fold metallo-hydrolase [Chloroflexota bacterium]